MNYIPLLIYTVSCFCTAFYAGGKVQGGYCLLAGWFMLLGRLEGLIWLANPLFLVSYLSKNSKRQIFYLSLALGLGLSHPLLDTTITDSGGREYKITHYGLGYYLWILAIVMSLILSLTSTKKSID